MGQNNYTYVRADLDKTEGVHTAFRLDTPMVEFLNLLETKGHDIQAIKLSRSDDDSRFGYNIVFAISVPNGEDKPIKHRVSRNTYRLIKELPEGQWEISEVDAENPDYKTVDATIKGTLQKAIKIAEELEDDYEKASEYGLHFEFLKKKPKAKKPRGT